MSFWECGDRYYAHDRPQCDQSNRRIGGSRTGRITEFCSADDDCRRRLRHFGSRSYAAKRAAVEAERSRVPREAQERATHLWREAYDDWQYARDTHRQCPYARAHHELYQALVRAKVLIEPERMSDERRLGRDPNTAREPIEGIPRQHNAPERRY